MVRICEFFLHQVAMSVKAIHQNFPLPKIYVVCYLACMASYWLPLRK